MRCHARSSAYLVHIFEQHLVAPCNNRACRLELWSPFMLNEELAGSLPNVWQVPLPIPLLVVIGEPERYMPLELSRMQPFSPHYQQSLVTRSQQRTNSARARMDNKAPYPSAQNISG
jgi:hypothetical protein